MLWWSQQRSFTAEPVTAELGISQDGFCGGTARQTDLQTLKKRGRPQRFSHACTQDFEGDVGLAQLDVVEGRADLAAVLASVLLSDSVQRYRGARDVCSALKGTCERRRKRFL